MTENEPRKKRTKRRREYWEQQRAEGKEKQRHTDQKSPARILRNDGSHRGITPGELNQIHQKSQQEWQKLSSKLNPKEEKIEEQPNLEERGETKEQVRSRLERERQNLVEGRKDLRTKGRKNRIGYQKQEVTPVSLEKGSYIEVTPEILAQQRQNRLKETSAERSSGENTQSESAVTEAQRDIVIQEGNELAEARKTFLKEQNRARTERRRNRNRATSGEPDEPIADESQHKETRERLALEREAFRAGRKKRFPRRERLPDKNYEKGSAAKAREQLYWAAKHAAAQEGRTLPTRGREVKKTLIIAKKGVILRPPQSPWGGRILGGLVVSNAENSTFYKKPWPWTWTRRDDK